MNNAQFMKVINMAWIEYDRECKNCDGYIYMCIVVKSLYKSGQISQWQCKRTRGKINKLINGYGTLSTFLNCEHGVNHVYRFNAPYYFWRIMVNHYNIFDELLTPQLVVGMLKMEHLQFFKSYR